MQVSRRWQYVAIVAIILCVVQWVSVTLWMIRGIGGFGPPGLMLNDASTVDPSPTYRDAVGVLSAVQGDPKALPPGAMRCEGQILAREIYPKLYERIGESYSLDGKQFRLPDYRGSFLSVSSDDGNRVMYGNLTLGKRTDESIPRQPWDHLEWTSIPVVWVIQAK